MKKESSALNRSLVLIITTCIGLIIAGVQTYFIATPVYESKSEIIVQLPQVEQNSVNTDQETNQLMMNTYSSLLSSQTVLEHTVHELKKEHIQYSISDLKEHLSIKDSEKSQILKVIITDDNPITAQTINQITCEVFRAELPKLMQVSKVEIASPATFSAKPSTPNHLKALWIGGFVGLLIGIILILLQWINQRHLTSRRFISRLKAPIIGSIPTMSKREQSVRIHRAENQAPKEVDQRTRDLSEANEMVDKLLKQETQHYDTLVRRRRKR